MKQRIKRSNTKYQYSIVRNRAKNMNARNNSAVRINNSHIEQDSILLKLLDYFLIMRIENSERQKAFLRQVFKPLKYFVATLHKSLNDVKADHTVQPRGGAFSIFNNAPTCTSPRSAASGMTASNARRRFISHCCTPSPFTGNRGGTVDTVLILTTAGRTRPASP